MCRQHGPDEQGCGCGPGGQGLRRTCHARRQGDPVRGCNVPDPERIRRVRNHQPREDRTGEVSATIHHHGAQKAKVIGYGSAQGWVWQELTEAEISALGSDYKAGIAQAIKDAKHLTPGRLIELPVKLGGRNDH